MADRARGASSTIGASGVVFGYATYLLTRGLFDRSVVELLIGLVVGVVWGGALLVEPGAALRGLVAGPPVRRHRRRDRRVGAGP